MIRRLLLRYALPVAAAVSLVAFVGVPYIDHVLAGWFRADVQLRARLVMTSLDEPLGELMQKGDLERAGAYLTRVAGDERLLGVLVCDHAGDPVLQTSRIPLGVDCSTSGLAGNQGNSVSRVPSGLIDISRFPLITSSGATYQVLLIHDLGYIDRRQTTARNFMLAIVVFAAAALAIFAGLGIRLLINRWTRVLLGDMRSKRFLDDAESGDASSPVLRRVRDMLRELEANQRLEIDFRENWTPQALQQVVREQLDGCAMVVVSNREPYIHIHDQQGQVAVQVPASGMVTAIEPIMRACSGTWIAHGSGAADREVVDRFDHVRVPPEDPSYTLRRVWLTEEEEEGYYYGFSNEGLWPLCHLAYVRPAFRERDWQQYVKVNTKFAEAVAGEVGSREAVDPDPGLPLCLAAEADSRKRHQGDDRRVLAHPVAERRDLRCLSMEEGAAAQHAECGHSWFPHQVPLPEFPCYRGSIH